MSPASKGENSGAQEQEAAAEIMAAAADPGAEGAAATADPGAEGVAVARAGAQPEPAADADAAPADETLADEAAPAGRATSAARGAAAKGPARRRAAAAAGDDAAAEDAKAGDAKAERAPAGDAKAGDAKAERAPAGDAKAGQASAGEASAEAGESAAKPAAARASASRGAGRAAKAPAKTPARKPKAPATSTEVKVDLPTDIFDAKVNKPLIHQVVVAQQAAARQGTHATKTRGQVRGGGKKPYRQKGTGRARQGSVRAPQFTGGGIVHGPVSRSHAMRTPKKMRAAALRGALSDRARHGLVQVVEGFVDGDSPKTAHAVWVLAAVTGRPAGSTNVLVVAQRSDEVTWKSLRNAAGVHVIDPGQLNTYDVLVSDRVVFTKPAFESFVARVGASQEDSDR